MPEPVRDPFDFIRRESQGALAVGLQADPAEMGGIREAAPGSGFRNGSSGSLDLPQAVVQAQRARVGLQRDADFLFEYSL